MGLPRFRDAVARSLHPYDQVNEEARRAVAQVRRLRRRRRSLGSHPSDRVTDLYMYGLALALTVAGLAGLLRDQVGSGDVDGESLRRVFLLTGSLLLGMGIRSGSAAGPWLYTPARIQHELLAGVPHRAISFDQVVRTMLVAVASSAAAGAAVMTLSDSPLAVEKPALLVAGFVAGGAALALAFGAALLASRFRISSRSAALTSWVVWVAGGLDLALGWRLSPAAWVASIALWPLDGHSIAAACGLGLSLVLLWAGLVVDADVELERARKRSHYLSSATASGFQQDLRGLILALHGRDEEWPRLRPLFRPPPPRAWTIWRRSWQGLLRFPAVRATRLVSSAVVVGMVLGSRQSGTLGLVVVICLPFFAGIELIEPASQSIDHETRRLDHLRTEWQFLVRLIVPSTILMAVYFACAAVVTLLAGQSALALMVFLSAPAMALAVTSWATYVIARGAPSVETMSRFALDPSSSAIYAFHTLPLLASGVGLVLAFSVASTPPSLGIVLVGAASSATAALVALRLRPAGGRH